MMARSKNWTESQQPQNQYTYGQYLFNVIAMISIAGALIGLAIYWALPSAKQTTQVFLVHADAKAEMRAIPFQENDLAQLNDAFVEDDVISLHEFNDVASFDLAASLKEQTNEPTTAIIVCSAVGAVDRDSQPVLLSTTSSGPGIPVKQLLEEFVKNAKCEQYVLVLDCGHDFSRPEAYWQNGQFKPGDDYNQFVSAVEELVEHETLTDKPLAVITSTDLGEIPLYSYNQRRTLFGLALQETLNRPYTTIAEFHQSLIDYCHEHGGEAAQTPQLFAKGFPAENEQLGISSLVAIKKDAGNEEEEEDSKPAAITQHEKTKKDLIDAALFWAERDRVIGDFKKANLLLPVDFDTVQWEKSIEQISESLACSRANQVQSSSLLGDFTSRPNKTASSEITSKFPGILADDPTSQPKEGNPQENTPDSSVDGLSDRIARLAIAKSFLIQHRAKFRAKYYLAIFDSLSWLDDSESLDRFEQALKNLNSDLNSSLFSDSNVEAAEWEAYREAAAEIRNKDEIANRCLKKLCQFLTDSRDNKHGFTREMGIVALLDSPLIESGPTSPETLPQGHDRAGLMKALEKNVSGRGEKLISSEIRNSNSVRRHQLFANFLEPQRADLNNKAMGSMVRSRIHDSVAYYLSVDNSRLRELAINQLEKVYNISLRNREDLIKVQQIDLDGEIIKLGLALNSGDDLNGQKVNLICELKPDSPFEIMGGTQVGNTIHLKNSDGTIEIRATQNTAQDKTGSPHTLRVRVENASGAIKFTRNELDKPIEIPLALPGENRVELSVVMSGKPTDGSALRPWPNRKETVEISIQNFFHRERKLQATLYVCKTVPGHSIMPGNIDATIKQETLSDLGSLLAIAQSSPIVLEKSTLGKPSKPAIISWPAPAEPNPNLKLLSSDQPVEQGLLCRVLDISQETPVLLKDTWIPIFPDTRDFAEKALILEQDQVRLRFVKKDFFRGKPAKLRCWLGDKDISGTITISENDNANRDPGIVVVDGWKAITQKFESEVPLFHIDVDDWPRRHTYVFQNGQFQDAINFPDNRYPNIEFAIPPTKPDAPGIKFTNFQSSDPSIKWALGYKQKTESPSVDGMLKVTCDIVNQFRFPDSKDYFEIKYANDQPQKRFFPREIKSYLSVDPTNSKRLTLKTTATDFTDKRKLEIDNYKIDPLAFVIGGIEPEKTQLDGRDITQIILDNQGPLTPEVEILTPSEKIIPKSEVYISIGNVKDLGVGLATSIAEVRVSAAIRRAPEPLEKPIVIQASGNKHKFVAPEQPGSYELNISIYDRIDNKSGVSTVRFMVKEKPKVETKEIANPKPITHVYKVFVFVGSKPLRAGQEPKLEMIPNDGIKMKRTGENTFVFTGLKAGEEYSVKGEFKPTKGIGFDRKGTSPSWKIPKNSPNQKTNTQELILK
ncbi:MAG: hypothetical protein P8J27_11130 [Mariniblastus sp.]|nr:hypothetical protein [Mariniblastus sp.]